jgi:hypothetical protein
MKRDEDVDSFFGCLVFYCQCAQCVGWSVHRDWIESRVKNKGVMEEKEPMD